MEKNKLFLIWKNFVLKEIKSLNNFTKNLLKLLAYLHCRRTNNMNQPTTWQIIFELKNVIQNGNYTLQAALAAANRADLQV